MEKNYLTTLTKPIKLKTITNKQMLISNSTHLPKLMSTHTNSIPLQNLTNKHKLTSDPRSLEQFGKGKPLLKNLVSPNLQKKQLAIDSIWSNIDIPKINENQDELRKTLESFHNTMNSNINIKQIEENKDNYA